MKKAFILCIFMSLIVTSSRNAIGTEIPLPAAEAYKKAELALRNMGMMPIYRDNDQMMIKTDRSLTKLTKVECDCGSRFGFPYIEDRNVKTIVAYQVQFNKIDDNSSNMDLIIVIDGFVDIYEGASPADEKTSKSGRRLNCKSTGVLEKKFEELLLK